jgi:hypothetical protein
MFIKILSIETMALFILVALGVQYQFINHAKLYEVQGSIGSHVCCTGTGTYES